MSEGTAMLMVESLHTFFISVFRPHPQPCLIAFLLSMSSHAEIKLGNLDRGHHAF